jgi:ubiquinone/menaquinone biosynthesis C-methylase UbiE
MDLRWLIYVAFGVPLLLLVFIVMLKVLRKIVQGPMPEFLADFIDNPLRRRIQPPDKTALRHKIEPGMTVLEVGPGTGTYTVATAQRVGVNGRVLAIDIEPRMIKRLAQKVQSEGLKNLDAQVADACALPYVGDTFDAIYMITVIGEIPAPELAIKEFHRVLSPTGTLAFSELFPDPDYPRRSTVTYWSESAGFRLKEKMGNLFYYTLVFEKA